MCDHECDVNCLFLYLCISVLEIFFPEVLGLWQGALWCCNLSMQNKVEIFDEQPKRADFSVIFWCHWRTFGNALEWFCRIWFSNSANLNFQIRICCTSCVQLYELYMYAYSLWVGQWCSVGWRCPRQKSNNIALKKFLWAKKVIGASVCCSYILFLYLYLCHCCGKLFLFSSAWNAFF